MNPRKFIESASINESLPALAGLEAVAVTNSIDVNQLPDALVTGTTLLDLSRVPSANVRSGISLSMLFASRVALAKNLHDQDEWLAEYQTALTQLGFALSGTARLNSRFNKLNVAVHEALIPFLTIAFGGAAVGPVILALLNNLKSMNADSPWITVFDQQSKRFNVHEMHFGAAIPNGTLTDIRYAVARLSIDMSATQVLFFKVTQTEADFESLTTTMSVSDSLMAVTEDDLKQRLSKLMKSYIWEAKV
jgi:hypothetical protein